jgi:hypothetical protein
MQYTYFNSLHACQTLNRLGGGEGEDVLSWEKQFGGEKITTAMLKKMVVDSCASHVVTDPDGVD